MATTALGNKDLAALSKVDFFTMLHSPVRRAAVRPGEEHFMIGSNVTRRRVIGGLAAGVSAATVISSDTLISEARAQSAQKTFVLVPGAFCGAWYWRRVSDRLEKQGHKVYALTLTG